MKTKNRFELQCDAAKRNILKAAFRLFSQRGIEAVTIPEVAEACGMSRASVFRYYKCKLDLVVAVNVWSWREYLSTQSWPNLEISGRKATAAECLDAYLEAFIQLYREHKDLLRFNHFFNVYVQGESHLQEQLSPVVELVDSIREQFSAIYRLAEQDGTLHTESGERYMFSSLTHIMLAAVTRYSMGLVYVDQKDVTLEDELHMLKRALLREFVVEPTEQA